MFHYAHNKRLWALKDQLNPSSSLMDSFLYPLMSGLCSTATKHVHGEAETYQTLEISSFAADFLTSDWRSLFYLSCKFRMFGALAVSAVAAFDVITFLCNLIFFFFFFYSLGMINVYTYRH